MSAETEMIADSARAIANNIGISAQWPVTLDVDNLGRFVESLALLVAQLADLGEKPTP